MNFKTLTLAAALTAAFAPAMAQISDNAVRIGVLTDMSGVYSDVSGKGTVIATQMAIDDFVAKEKPTFKVEVVSADHQNKGDIAANKAREWFERDKVDVVSELVTTSVALAVQKIAKEKNRIALISGAASTRVTNEDCNDVTVHWTYDTYAVANGTAKAVTKTGGKKWFFLTADYAFGHSLEADAAAVVKANGGEVLGAVRRSWACSTARHRTTWACAMAASRRPRSRPTASAVRPGCMPTIRSVTTRSSTRCRCTVTHASR